MSSERAIAPPTRYGAAMGRLRNRLKRAAAPLAWILAWTFLRLGRCAVGWSEAWRDRWRRWSGREGGTDER